MGLTKAERKVLKVLLHKAASEFSNHCCNDFHLVNEAELTEKEVLEVSQSLVDFGFEEEVTDNPCVQDWCLMRMLAHKL
jgi:hypothetical protein